MLHRLLIAAGAALLLASCGTPRNSAIACTQEGCECATEGELVPCGEERGSTDNSQTCTIGMRTCHNGRLGACSNTGVQVEGWTTKPKGLGTASGCAGPCDPGCRQFTDNAVGLDAGAGTMVNDSGGLTLSPNEAGCPAKPCIGLECSIPKCTGGATTTITGKVYDPAGKVPLYNAQVFIPSGPLKPLPEKLSCDQCTDGSTSVIATTKTDARGVFTLTGVPAGTNIPLVVQIGKWRRVSILPSVTPCAVNTLTDPNLTRLPRNKREGNIPKIAFVSGSADPFECMLMKMGVDTAEFTPWEGDGRINWYVANGRDLAAPGLYEDPYYLLNDPSYLAEYDMVVLACEGNEYTSWKAAKYRTNLIDYANLGGRVFMTHYSYSWMYYATKEWGGVANWARNSWSSTSINASLDTSFAKGLAFRDWLVNVGATPTAGVISLVDPRRDVASVNAGSQRWMTMSTSAGSGVPHFTFNTPFGKPAASQCGRAVFSDFHVSAGALGAGGSFPTSCATGNLSAQEKALEFMFFDLASCIEADAPATGGMPPYPAPVTLYRDYEAVCGIGERPVWRFFDWKTTTPADSFITFSAQTADTSAALPTATPIVDVGAASGAPVTTWKGADVGAALATATGLSPISASKKFLRVNITLWPTSDGYNAPVLDAWRQAYSCVATE